MALDAAELSTLSDDDCWHAVQTRDRAADGRFWVCVRTTGIYCRPSCASRQPNRVNVTFQPSREAARAAGFRACLRCRPDDTDRTAAAVADACHTIVAALAASDPPPDLAALATAAGLSRFHFQRVFKATVGVTPRGYAAAWRISRVRETLPQADSVTEAIYAAGYGSSRQFYAASEGALGMAPAAYRDGGRDATIRFTVAPCSLGAILVAATERGLCAVRLGDDPAALTARFQQQFRHAGLCGDDAGFNALVARVVALVEHPSPVGGQAETGPAGAAANLPIDIRGTAFQHLVWDALRAIPLGSTLSYAELAARVGTPRAVRAVGAACGANPVAIAIPCHRAVRSDGALAGYAWGIERKAELLRREGAR